MRRLKKLIPDLYPSAKRLWKIAKAFMRLFAYLSFIGMWRGECAFEGYTLGGKLTKLAACRGSLGSKNFKITRIFWEEKP